MAAWLLLVQPKKHSTHRLHTWTKYAHYALGDLYGLSSRSEPENLRTYRARAACNFCHCLGTKSFLEGCFAQANGPRFLAWKCKTVRGVLRSLRNVNFKSVIPCSPYNWFYVSNLTSDFITDYGIASMLNHTIDFNLVTKFIVCFTWKLETTPKSDVRSVSKSDISIKRTTWTSYQIAKTLPIKYLKVGDNLPNS